MDNKDIQAMRSAVDKLGKTGQLIVRALAMKERTHRISDLFRIRTLVARELKVRLGRDEIDEFFSECDRLGLGKLKRERVEGGHDRFTWREGVIYTDIARRLLRDQPTTIVGTTGTVARPAASSKRQHEAALAAIDRRSNMDSSTTVRVSIRLASGQELSLTLDEARDLKGQLAGF